ncbi:MAG TPA: hypothetical protein VFV50_17805, partial [Bdellovibrionales bacterium]|nr:hypothetical protein [Bdellovibrionales bacterium]
MLDLQFRKVNAPEPHVQRTREIMRSHPEIRKLFGPTPITAIYVIGLVMLQVLMAHVVKDAPWWVVLLVAYLFGAFVCHGLWAL